ncbi:MAG: hypothetical protein R3300_16000, partial [Candidatus Promineifilaceae bacterium]|nr:hypothetical protein [Candidatus Promineifilaceae bacterium]
MHSLPRLFARLLGPVAHLGVRPQDSEAERLQKALLVGGSLFVLPAAFIWALLYFVYDEPRAGGLTAAYALIIVLATLYLAATGRSRPLSVLQLLSTLVLPFVLTVILGGFMNASAVMIGALMAPLGALLYADYRRAAWWFGAYAG